MEPLLQAVMDLLPQGSFDAVEGVPDSDAMPPPVESKRFFNVFCVSLHFRFPSCRPRITSKVDVGTAEETPTVSECEAQTSGSLKPKKRKNEETSRKQWLYF